MAVFGLVPTQSEFDETHSALPGVALQIPTGHGLPAQAAGDAQVSLEMAALFSNIKYTPPKLQNPIVYIVKITRI